MATLVLAAAGSAVGGAMGGSFAGLTSMVIGKAVGATLGSVIDQRLMGLGAEPVETGRMDRFRIMGSSEGASLPRMFGRMRVAGQIIWSSRFLESVSSERVGGKGGGGGGQEVREFSYSVSLAVALCEGEVSRIGRIWADGQPVEQSGLTWRLHSGTEDQQPDPLISAIEGESAAPAYRGTSYVVFENLALGAFGNRIPQFNFEVFRRPTSGLIDGERSPALDMRGVAVVPGSGEYSLATEPVYLERGKGDNVALNVHNDQGIPDLKASLGQLRADLPNVRSVSLVVSWFGNDLRCDRCGLRPAVEQSAQDGSTMKWRVSGADRASAHVVSKIDGRPAFGGTPADASVIQAIKHMRGTGQSVMFYPFILMDIQADNGLKDPWSGAVDQPLVPWRGRITLSKAPGRSGSPDKTIDAAAEVDAFFGNATASDFDISDGNVRYTGADGWSYRRFILHYAHLCAHAGGVHSFCIGSELRGLTQIRDSAEGFPAVRALCDLANEVKSILGQGTKVGYAADWSEYFGYHPADGSGDVLFHLDELWGHPTIDFVGIDNYMPLSDWRDGADHADQAAGSVYSLDYLQGNVAGGEGYDWHYPDTAARDAQDRQTIEDGAYGEDWVYRYKDLVSWWSKPHSNRVGGVKSQYRTDWVPQSKPIWFTELGCPAVDKGTNQPNVFFDPKSSESFFPYFSNGVRDDFIQYRYLQAMFAHWNDKDNNPSSSLYSGRMVDMSRAHVWAWDARPWPDFPNRIETWIDGSNFPRGHWLNGRCSIVALAEVVAEICDRSELAEIEVSTLYGGVSGYVIDGLESARQSLQPLMLAYGFDSFSKDGQVAFSNRNGRVTTDRSPSNCVETSGEPVVSLTRGPSAETAGRVTLGYLRSDMDYQAGAAEALAPDVAEPSNAQTQLSLVLSEGQADAAAERWLSEGRIARDTLAFSLPPSDLAVTAGDVISMQTGMQADLYRIDRVEEMGHRAVSAVRIEADIYNSPVYREAVPQAPVISAATPVYSEFLDLPLLKGSEVPHAPHFVAAKTPWAGPVAVYSASDDAGYSPSGQALRPGVVGETLEALEAGTPGLVMGGAFRVRIASGQLQSRSTLDFLNGANVAVLRFGGTGDWEVFQFQEAELVAPREYRLSGLLRGQAGTDGVMPAQWPAGTEFVLLDAAATQIDLAASARGLDRHYRVGPAAWPYDHPSYSHRILAFDGVGLRPYKPAHLCARRVTDGSILLNWTRRTRIDGDSWAGTEVPLGEDREAYHLRIVTGSSLVRQFEPNAPSQLYSKTQQIEDDAPSALSFEVSQISGQFGPGPYERIEFNG